MYRISTALINELQFSFHWPRAGWSQGQLRQWALNKEAKGARLRLAWLTEQQPLWSQKWSLLQWLAPLMIALLAFSSMTGILHWQDQGRINLLLLLSYVWALPMLLLLFSLLLLPWLPRLWWWQWAIKSFGHWQAWRPVVLLLSQSLAIYWLLFSWLAFMFWLLIDDFYFVWASTLMLSSDWVRLFDVLAWPWAWLWPDIRIDAELLAASREWQGQGGTLGPDQHWWPFISLVLAFWLLLPRFVLWLLAWFGCYWSLKQQVRRAAQQQFDLWATQPMLASSQSISQAPSDQPKDWQQGVLQAPCLEISWQQALPAAPWQLGQGSYEQDLARVAQLSQQGQMPLRLWVKAKSQPLAELADLLHQLPQSSLEGELVVLGDLQAAQGWQWFVTRHLPHFHLRAQQEG